MQLFPDASLVDVVPAGARSRSTALRSRCKSVGLDRPCGSSARAPDRVVGEAIYLAVHSKAIEIADFKIHCIRSNEYFMQITIIKKIVAKNQRLHFIVVRMVCELLSERQMRVDQSVTTARSDRTDDLAVARASFDRHVQAARDRCSGRDSRAATDNTDVVTVKRGDTLWDIARRHGTSMSDLYGANPQFDPQRQDGIPEFDRGRHGGWDPDYIRPGDRIKLPSHPPSRPHLPGGHPRRPPPEVCTPGGPNTRTPTPNEPNTPSPSNPSVGMGSTTTPNGPSTSGAPNVRRRRIHPRAQILRLLRTRRMPRRRRTVQAISTA
jgi:hypothetical protein